MTLPVPAQIGRPAWSNPRRLLGALVLAVTAVAVSGCGGMEKNPCPRVAILDQASRVTKFAPGAAMTPENVLYHAEMTATDISCTYSGASLQDLEATTRVQMVAERGPALTTSTPEFEYFVVITDRGGTVLNKRTFPLKLDFTRGGRIEFIEEAWQYYRLQYGGAGGSYEVWVGFQLTDAELQYNRENFR